MKTQQLFENDERELIFELIYDANRNLMSAKELGEAILGMAACMSIAGRTVQLDFESVHVYAIGEGSVKTRFTFTRREQRTIYIAAVGSALGNILSTTFLGTFTLIGQYGLPALKSPTVEILEKVDKKIIDMCTNADFRKSVTKIALPINELNQKVTIKIDGNSYEINCDNQYKFITEDEELILPELRNGETVKLVGTLTRMNMKNNDLGFEYHDKTLSISPSNPEKNVATEYHQFTPMPRVNVTGIVIRNSDYEVPKLKVISMSEFTEAQTALFDNTEDSSSSGRTLQDDSPTTAKNVKGDDIK